jgi:sec-independent protein translocase protein TatA
VSSLGVTELLIVLAIVLLVLGPKRLPSLGRQLGGGFRGLRKSIRNSHDKAPAEPGPARFDAATGASVAGLDTVDGDAVTRRPAF